ncbi:MAG: hypothetical protein IT372_03890, partial [Polyangiaceae bacterium]|nr:hypothetical protein [Polyangiaceae bacterium]
LDFGIAKIVEASGPVSEDGMPASLSTQALTTVGVVVGTPAYMSPEQCRGDPVDGRSDVYACGIMLYLLVTGRLPFQPTGAPWEVAMEHLRKPPPAPSTFLPGIHPGLEAAILTALAKWPAQRQQTAAEMRDELAKLLPALADTITGGARAPAGEDDALPVESLRSRAVQSVRAAVEEEDQEDQQWGDDRPGPPSFRADTETRPVLMDTLRPPGPPSEGAVPTRRRAGPDDKTDPVPVEVARGLAAPVIDPPPSSEEPPLGARVIGADGADLAGAPPAAAGDPAGSGGRVWTTTKVSPISPLAGVAPPPQVDVIAPPPRPGGAPPAPLRVAPRDEQTAPARRRPQRYRSEADIARLIVPAAVLVGVALGVLAFLLMR